MSTMTKVFVVLTTVLSIALSCMFIAATAQWDNWRDLAQKNQTARNAAIQERDAAVASAQASLAIKDEELASKSQELTNSQSETQRLSDELARLKSDNAVLSNERLAAEAGRTKLQEILDVTANELKSLQKQNQTLLAESLDLQSRNARLNGRVLDLTTQVTILTDETRNLQEKLYAAEHSGQSVAARRGAIPAAAAAFETPGVLRAEPGLGGVIRGQVAQVDGIYAAIDVGETSGVAPGMAFMVYRDGVFLGQLTIDTVEPKRAGGKLSALTQGGVRQGDAVAYGLN